MSKYIIKNCPCFDKYGTQCYDTPTLPVVDIPLCQDCTDCVLKQIVELCKEDWEDMTVSKFQSELLDKLDIQEVE